MRTLGLPIPTQDAPASARSARAARRSRAKRGGAGSARAGTTRLAAPARIERVAGLDRAPGGGLVERDSGIGQQAEGLAAREEAESAGGLDQVVVAEEVRVLPEPAAHPEDQVGPALAEHVVPVPLRVSGYEALHLESRDVG